METLTQRYEEAVLKTVMFWSDKSFRTRLNQNNGDDSPNGGISFMLMNMVAHKAQESVTELRVIVLLTANVTLTITHRRTCLRRQNTLT